MLSLTHSCPPSLCRHLLGSPLRKTSCLGLPQLFVCRGGVGCGERVCVLGWCLLDWALLACTMLTLSMLWVVFPRISIYAVRWNDF